MIDILKPLISKFMPFAKEKMGFSRPPRLFLKTDSENGSDPMGKTGFYDPQAESITIYISGRHPKDIMRSLSHELMHHTQKCNGDFDNVTRMGEQGYAQSDPHMRNMEIQAYQASIVFRDWEDSLKETIYYEHLQKGENTMSTKDWRNKELTTLLSEAWGFKFNTLQEFDEFNGNGEIQEENAEKEVQEEGGSGRADSVRQKSDRMQPDRVKPMEEAEDADEDTDKEELDEISALAAGPALMGKRDGEDEDEDKEETNEDSQKELQERIATLLTKYLKG
jgi:hypothetical protein